MGNNYYFLINPETNRYLFSSGPVFEGTRGSEGGWINQATKEFSPAIVGTDLNYYHRAVWYIKSAGNDKYYLINYKTKRLLF